MVCTRYKSSLGFWADCLSKNLSVCQSDWAEIRREAFDQLVCIVDVVPPACNGCTAIVLGQEWFFGCRTTFSTDCQPSVAGGPFTPLQHDPHNRTGAAGSTNLLHHNGRHMWSRIFPFGTVRDEPSATSFWPLVMRGKITVMYYGTRPERADSFSIWILV